MSNVSEVARVPLPTPFGEFEVRAFETPSGHVYLAMVSGDVSGATDVLARVHSECLTGDALGSLRCDCGIQLRTSLRRIAAEGTGVLVYATGHEGRGIGIVNKLKAYVEQDHGSDTVDANLHLGLPVDSRRYDDAAEVLKTLGVQSIRLITNNPSKVDALRADGVVVTAVETLPVASHARNLTYLSTKRDRLGHANPLGTRLPGAPESPPDVSEILGPITPHADRPFVVVKYAQSLDGRIATVTGDSKWISGEEERTVSHALRARCDVILVGVGTVLADDPQLTVRMVPGASPIRVVLDSTLRVPEDARVLDDDAATLVITTERSDRDKRDLVESRGAGVRVARRCGEGVEIKSALKILSDMGVRSVLVEGGAKVITSFLKQGLVDRVIVSIAPKLIGTGTEGVGDLGTRSVTEGVTLANRSVHVVGQDILVAGSVVPVEGAEEEPDVETAV
jgi:3,4-dihydroxy 2-butanone 4-phosphate synthase/GTP cyclohydrolase II